MMLKALIPRALKGRIKQTLTSLGLYLEEGGALAYESEWWRRNTPNWQSILERDPTRWQLVRAASKNGPRILIATSIGGLPSQTIVDSLLAVALTLRGAQVHILLCDASLPACFLAATRHFPDMQEFVKRGPSRRICAHCFSPGYKMLNSLGLPIHRQSEFVSREESRNAKEISSQISVPEIPEYRLDGVAAGEQAVAGALRFYASGNLEGQPYGEAVLRRYFHASLLTVYALRRLLSTWSFECVSCAHGVYVPHGLVPGAARQQNVRCVVWSPTYRKRTFIFSHDETYHHTMLSEPTSHWEDMPWSPEMEAEILDYLKSRWYGTRDWIAYAENPREDISAIAEELDIDFSKPTVGLLTNVMWDAQVHYHGNAFPNVLEWVLETIRYFAKRTDLQLIVRIHPAEVRAGTPSCQRILDEIRAVFPKLPENVFIIPAESEISSYAVMLKCDSAIIFATKMGVELTSMGIPVIVAGDAWIRNKGVSTDASSPEEYFELLDGLPLKTRLDEDVTQRALKYAYHFFFRRMIPLPCVAPSSPYYELQLSDIDELLPGRSVGLDLICNGILKGDEFIYPAELQRESFDER